MVALVHATHTIRCALLVTALERTVIIVFFIINVASVTSVVRAADIFLAFSSVLVGEELVFALVQAALTIRRALLGTAIERTVILECNTCRSTNRFSILFSRQPRPYIP